MSAKIVLTVEAYKAIEAAAFKNCRTVSQELSYRIERQIEGKAPAMEISSYVPIDRYDAPAATPTTVPVAAELPHAILPSPGWTPEQETEIYELGKAAGLGDAQITALHLIHKTYDATKTAIESEKIAA